MSVKSAAPAIFAAATLLTVLLLIPPPRAGGVSVLSNLGDFLEFADDWNHFPRTAPLLPDSGTRWPRASSSSRGGGGNKPAAPTTVVRVRLPDGGGYDFVERRFPKSSPSSPLAVVDGDDVKKVTRKREVLYPVPIIEVPLEVEIPIDVRRNLVVPDGVNVRAGAGPGRAGGSRVDLDRKSGKAAEEKTVSKTVRSSRGAKTGDAVKEIVKQKAGSGGTVRQRVVRQNFDGDSGSGETFGIGRPRVVYGSADPRPPTYTRQRGGYPSYPSRPPKYDFGYIAKAVGKGGGRYYGGDGSGSDEIGGGGVAEFGHRERRDGYSTNGNYFVDLPDGRRQRVDYYVNGDSGFVAKVAYTPIGGGGGGGYGGGGRSRHSGSGENN